MKVLNRIILISFINNAIKRGINIETKNHILGVKEILREPFSFCLNSNFCTIITEIRGNSIGTPIKFVEIELSFPPIDSRITKNESVITYVNKIKYNTFFV